jgi:2-polyprenyl-3-methyl-5-hydroxy-6-metoxy-1,4-benzoquinol methylase
MPDNLQVIVNCRICHSADLQSILNLGNQPLANSLIDSEVENEIYAPLEIVRCNSCTTVQLSVNVNPELMFKDYLWVTGTTKTALEHLTKFSDLIDKKLEINGKSLLEVGCNDGSLLKILNQKNFKKLIGVDPAKNIIDRIDIPGIELYSQFFNLEFSRKFLKSSKKIDVVVARNVFSHVPDIVSCLKAVNEILTDDGVFIMEFHEASKIVEEFHYDSIYHEHTFYHSIKSITTAARMAELHPFDIDFSPISGGSFIVYFSKIIRNKTQALLEIEAKELASGVQNYEKWLDFARASKNNILIIKNYLATNQHRKICGFGASARSSTLINAVGHDFKQLTGIADNNLLKQGKKSPGIHIVIDKPDKIIDEKTEIIIIFPFNFEQEIINFLRNELLWSGEIFLPLPTKPRIINF